MSESDKLVISFKFPPDNDVSGIVVAKRIITDNSKVDVLLNHVDNDFLDFVNLDNFINERFEVSVDAKRDSVDCIFDFINQGMDIIDKKDYKEIYSRSWYMSNHYLALEYKFSHPDVFWTAEFSDPVLRNMQGRIKNYKSAVLDNQEYIDRLNQNIRMLNFKELDNPANTFHIAEYLTFLFADKIIFTNVNQREMMLESYDDDVKQLVIDKSQIIPHPTLDKSYYHQKESDIDLDKGDINIAYFGTTYYILRHFEPLFYAFESLNHKYKDKIKFYIFIDSADFLKILIDELEFKDNIIIQKLLNYIEFLNATTKFDILLVNDTITENRFNVNPYLPSKLADCKGSSKDIWAIYETGSTLSKEDVKYRSSMGDFKQSKEVLVQILSDYGYDDEDSSFDENFYEKRITDLNRIVRKEFDAKNRLEKRNSKLKRDIKRLKAENKRLKDKNEEILSSNSWKITKPLRDLRNK
ncbi:hypothetical protein [Methanobrevibacter sp.]|uniref:hypothetical protein n=1 Tax=Methanobrevibacter sp. TaxID=66852 RepID=UPI00386C694A